MTSVTLRPVTTVIPASERGVRLSRRIVAGSLAAAGPTVAGTAIRTVDVDAPTGLRVRGEWVRGRGVVWDDAVILYVHGSGYALCSARTHRGRGGSCALEIWPDQMHVFQALPLLVPEARVALRSAARFVRSQVEQAQGMKETS